MSDQPPPAQTDTNVIVDNAAAAPATTRFQLRHIFQLVRLFLVIAAAVLAVIWLILLISGKFRGRYECVVIEHCYKLKSCSAAYPNISVLPFQLCLHNRCYCVTDTDDMTLIPLIP